MVEDIKKSARECYRRGWATIPLRENSKIPNLPKQHGFLTNKPSREDYSKFVWGNYGIVCGALSGITVLDLDMPEAADTLNRHDLQVPVAPTVYTPGGGMHIFFRYTPTVKTGVAVIGKGVDIRNDGSYVVGYGSVIDGKEYVWDEDLTIGDYELPEPPEWMSIRRTDTNGRAPTDMSAKVSEGSRNNTLLSVAGSLVKKNVPPAVIVGTLTYLNSNWIEPPLPNSEVKGVAESAERWR